MSESSIYSYFNGHFNGHFSWLSSATTLRHVRCSQWFAHLSVLGFWVTASWQSSAKSSLVAPIRIPNDEDYKDITRIPQDDNLEVSSSFIYIILLEVFTSPTISFFLNGYAFIVIIIGSFGHGWSIQDWSEELSQTSSNHRLKQPSCYAMRKIAFCTWQERTRWHNKMVLEMLEDKRDWSWSMPYGPSGQL